MWPCPRCGRSFANRDQSHACGPLDLDRHLADRDPEVVAIFERLVELAERNGPVTVLPEKSRIAFQVRMSFAAFTLRRRWVDGHVVLARRLEHPRFRRVETFSPRNHLHQSGSSTWRRWTTRSPPGWPRPTGSASSATSSASAPAKAARPACGGPAGRAA